MLDMCRVRFVDQVKQYYESCKLQFECNYKDSKREGITKRCDEKGYLSEYYPNKPLPSTATIAVPKGYKTIFK